MSSTALSNKSTINQQLLSFMKQQGPDAATNANLAQSNIAEQHNKHEIVTVITPPQNSFSILRTAASGLASKAVRTISPLMSNGRLFLGQVSAKVFSPLPPVVTKRNSTGHLTMQPGALPLQPPTYSSSNPAVHPVTPDPAFTISCSFSGQWTGITQRLLSIASFCLKKEQQGHLFTQTGLPQQPPADSSSNLAVFYGFIK
jgi:hypothetical protein